MESSGVAGTVQLTRAAWALTHLPDTLASSRLMRVKGKAEEMEVMTIEASSQAAATIILKLQTELSPHATPRWSSTGTLLPRQDSDGVAAPAAAE